MALVCDQCEVDADGLNFNGNWHVSANYKFLLIRDQFGSLHPN